MNLSFLSCLMLEKLHLKYSTINNFVAVISCHLCAMEFKLLSSVLLRSQTSCSFAYRIHPLDVSQIPSWIPLHNNS